MIGKGDACELSFLLLLRVDKLPLQRSDNTGEMFSLLLTGGETALWCAAHNVLLQQLTNRYGHYAIKELLVPYSAQVPLF